MSFLRKYATGSGADVYINIPKAGSANHAVSADWTTAAGDVKVSIDGGAAANIGTLPTAIAMGNSAIWKFVFTNGELTGKQISVTVSDSATKAVDDTGFVIETFGNASAMYPFDLSTATQSVNVTQLLGTAWLTPGTAGTPDVNVKLISDDATAANNAESFFDGTGYAGTNNVIPLVTTTTTATTATNVTTVNGLAANVITATSIASDAITAAKIADGAIDAATFASDALSRLGVLTAGTMQAGSTSTTAVLASALSYANDIIIGATLLVTGGTGSGQARQITDYVGATDTATVDTWITTPDNTSTYVVFGTAPSAASSVPPTVNEIVDGVWDEATSGHTTSGTFGEQLSTDVDAILVDTAEIGAAGVGLTNVTVKALAAQAKSDVNAEVVDALTVDVVADSVPADGSRPTLAQAAYMLVQFMTEQSRSGTTVTVKKPDGSTALFTLTIDSATDPTSITRAT